MKRARPRAEADEVVTLRAKSSAYRGKILTALAPASPKEIEEPRLLYINDGVITVDDAGRISRVEPFDRAALQCPALDLHPCVLMPGLVDAHTHFPQTQIIGRTSGSLLSWLTRSVFPEEARFSNAAYASAVASEFVHRLLMFGTTTCVAFSSSSPSATNTLFEALARAGLRAVAGLTLMDQGCPEIVRLGSDDAMAACEDLIARWHGYDHGRLSFAVTPRFALSCSRRLLEAAAKLAATHGLYIQTHIAETPNEGEQALAAHPFAADYLDIYVKVGLLSRRTLLAHAIHLSPSEWDRIEEHEAKIVHCPDSNFFLGSGRMRLEEATVRGIHVALGSDVAGGRTFDMRRAISSAYDNSLCVGGRATPEALFSLATLGGADVLGLSSQIGSLEVGKEADFIAVRVPDYAHDLNDVLAQIAFASDTTRVERVFVRGRQVARRSPDQ